MSIKFILSLMQNHLLCYVPRKIAHLLYQTKVKAEVYRIEKLGVISKVDQPTEWCSYMVIVPKGNDKVRICLDPLRLNENIIREAYTLPSADQILAQLSGSKVFTKLDCNSGFWKIPLTKESSLLTTSITPFGKYCYNVLPFGISPASEHYQKVMKENLSHCEGTVVDTDDILVYGTDKKNTMKDYVRC